MQPLSVETAKQVIRGLDAICQVRPTAELLKDLSACYFTLGDVEKSLPLAEAAWRKNKQADIGMNLALVLKELGRHKESTQVVEQAYWLDPGDMYVRMGYGEALLKAGLWKQAWSIYDNCRPSQQGAAHHLLLPRAVQEWNGEPLPDGHELLVINEGGAGDRLSYPRWLPELDKKGVNWKFYPYAELFSFFERVFPREKLVADGEQINATHWCTAFSLPAKLDIGPHEVPDPLPITAKPESVEKYKMTRIGLPIVGLCYAAREDHQGGRKFRSLSEGQAMRLVCMTGDKIQWVNLQHGENLPYPVSNLPFHTWDDTAGLIANLDAVVTVDTSILHLAGAMGKPVACLLAGNSCWKYLRTGKKLKWYPSATFYRNETRGFEGAISELISAIRNGSAW